MLRRAARDTTHTLVASIFGARLGSILERRLTGHNAITRRALIAHRAAMALTFHKAKRAT